MNLTSVKNFLIGLAICTFAALTTYVMMRVTDALATSWSITPKELLIFIPMAVAMICSFFLLIARLEKHQWPWQMGWRNFWIYLKNN